MEANEAPEKIYLQENTTTDCYGEFWPEWFEARAKDSDIEYTRTDAFIEKAWEWVDMHFHETEVADRWGESRCVVMSGHDVFKDDLLKDFKKYMKGEGV